MPKEASKQNAQWDPYEDESSPGETIRGGDGVQRRTSQLVALAKKNIAEKEAREKEARAQRIEQMKQRMRDVTGMENADPNVESGKKRKGLALSRFEDSGEVELYVGCIANDASFSEFIAKIGRVIKSDPPSDRFGRFRPFAFVTVEPERVDSVLACDGVRFGGRRLRVEKSRGKGPKKETRNECEMMKIVRQKMVTSDATPRERRKISLSLDDPTPNQVTDTSSAADSDENAASDRSSAGAANEADAEDPVPKYNKGQTRAQRPRQ